MPNFSKNEKKKKKFGGPFWTFFAQISSIMNFPGKMGYFLSIFFPPNVSPSKTMKNVFFYFI